MSNLSQMYPDIHTESNREREVERTDSDLKVTPKINFAEKNYIYVYIYIYNMAWQTHVF